jgi:hypothetical protein
MSKPFSNLPSDGGSDDLREKKPKRVPPAELRLAPRRGLSRTESATYMGVSPSKFDELRKDGRISPPRIVDSRKVFDIYALDRDFESFPVEAVGDAEEDWNTSV